MNFICYIAQIFLWRSPMLSYLMIFMYRYWNIFFEGFTSPHTHALFHTPSCWVWRQHRCLGWGRSGLRYRMDQHSGTWAPCWGQPSGTPNTYTWRRDPARHRWWGKTWDSPSSSQCTSACSQGQLLVIVDIMLLWLNITLFFCWLLPSWLQETQ